MTETAKIELSNEEDTLESIAIAFGAPMVNEKFRAEVGQILENSEKYHGIFTLSDDSVSTDKLSVEKLQEQLNTAKKALTEEIESIEKYLDKYGMSSYGANTRQAYLEGLKKALAEIGGDDEC